MLTLFKTYNFLIFSTILSLSLSQNIITSWHYDKVQMYDIQKLTKILLNQLPSKITEFPEFDSGDFKFSAFKLTNVQVSLYDSYVNYNSGLILLTPNKLSLSFNFSYVYQVTHSEAQLELKINTLKIRIKNNKEEQTQSAEFSMVSGQSDFTVYGVSDKEISEKMRQALYQGFTDNKILNEHIAKKIDMVEYYKNFYNNKKTYQITTSNFLGSKSYSILLNRFVGFCEDVTGKYDTGLCYYSGEIDLDKTDRSSDPIKNEQFISAEDNYKMFINGNLLNVLGNKVISDGLPEKNYKQGTVSKELIYDFTVSSLKKYFSGLDSYKDDLIWETRVNIKEIHTDQVKYTVSFLIDNKNVFSIDVTTGITLSLSINKTIRFNICIDQVKTSDITVSSGSVTISFLDGLKDAIDDSFDKNIKLCLTQNGATLRDYFSIIKSGYILKEGVYLEGNQLYQ